MKDWKRRLLRTLDRLYMFLRERKRNVWIAALICGSTVFVLGTAIACYAKSAQSELASQFIRFHVLANSDTDEDQALKLKVRECRSGGYARVPGIVYELARDKREFRAESFAHQTSCAVRAAAGGMRL